MVTIVIVTVISKIWINVKIDNSAISVLIFPFYHWF